MLTTPNDALIGNPTTVKAVATVGTPLITLTELAPVDACSNMATWEPVDIDHDEIGFEDEYDKVDTIDHANPDESMTVLNESIREQEELEDRLRNTEWTSSIDKDKRRKLKQQTALNEKEHELYIMRASKTILSILHRGFNKIKQDGGVIVLDEKAAKKLHDRLYS